MSTSLGYHSGPAASAMRGGPAHGVRAPASSGSDLEAPRAKISPCKASMPVPRGLVPILFYMAFAFAVPTVYLYAEDIDYSDDGVRGGVIGLSAFAAILMVYSNCCCCWYNMLLAFHTALEVKVIDTALTYAYADGTSDAHMALNIVGAVVVIVHLVPFYVYDGLKLLTLLATAGVVVNTSILVFLDPSLLMVFVFASSLALLADTMIIAGVCELRTSLLSIVKDAMASRTCITCNGFEL